MALPRPVLADPEMTNGSARCPAVREAEAKSLWLGPPDDALAARAGAASLARDDAVAARRSAPERDMVTPLPTWAAEHARVMRGRPEGPGPASPDTRSRTRALFKRLATNGTSRAGGPQPRANTGRAHERATSDGASVRSVESARSRRARRCVEAGRGALVGPTGVARDDELTSERVTRTASVPRATNGRFRFCGEMD